MNSLQTESAVRKAGPSAVWKRNLTLLWIGCFLCSAGTSMILPFLPLYVQELGVTDVHEAALWSALIFGSNHLMVTLVSPVWGRLSDIYGQKMMLVRGGVSMGALIIAMGFVTTPAGLLLLRIVFGTVAGFMSIATALMAIETPKEHVGKVLGTLQTGIVSGQLLGPLFGGIMAETVGMRNSFFLTGTLILISTTLAIFGVRETKTYRKFTLFHNPSGGGPSGRPEDGTGARETADRNSLYRLIRQTPILLTILLSSFFVSVTLQSVSPVISLYVQSLHIQRHVEIISGLIFAASALGSMIAAPVLGRLGDKVGHSTILLVSLASMALLNIPQAMVNDPWTLLALRFVSGLCVGGLMPSISSLLRHFTPQGIQGSIFGYNGSATSLGNVSGAFFGGLVSSYLGISYVFYAVSAILFVHCLILASQYKKIKAGEAKDSPLH